MEMIPWQQERCRATPSPAPPHLLRPQKQQEREEKELVTHLCHKKHQSAVMQGRGRGSEALKQLGGNLPASAGVVLDMKIR